MNLAEKLVMRPIGAPKIARNIEAFGFTNRILVDGRQHGGDGCRAREPDIPPRTRSAAWVIHSGPPKWRMAQENHRDAQISDTGLDDLKDFAPHRLDLRNSGAECRCYGLSGARRVPDRAIDEALDVV